MKMKVTKQVTTMKRMFTAALMAAALAASGGAAAQNDLEGALVNSKWAGACGMVKQLATFQETTKMPGGDEFVMRFLTTETARLGKTPLEFVEHCKGIVEFYGELIKAAKEGAAPPSGISSTAARILAEELPAARPAVRTEPKRAHRWPTASSGRTGSARIANHERPQPPRSRS